MFSVSNCPCQLVFVLQKQNGFASSDFLILFGITTNPFEGIYMLLFFLGFLGKIQGLV